MRSALRERTVGCSPSLWKVVQSQQAAILAILRLEEEAGKDRLSSAAYLVESPAVCS